MADRPKSIEEMKALAHRSEMPHVKAMKAKLAQHEASATHQMMTKLQKNACDHCMGKTSDPSGTLLG
uniref:Uncharacterized protein n=1 Tax=viral metagenome TaxID=1070528 RepID=A0A6C0BPK1_9ZZZZ